MNDDLIRRQAAKDYIDSQKGRPFIGCTMGEAMKIMLDEVPSAQPGWIPVTERMPGERDAGVLKKLGKDKRSDYVLATVEVKGERMTVTACTYDGKWDWKMKYAFPDYKVVAWMPLPEPWEGGQK